MFVWIRLPMINYATEWCCTNARFDFLVLLFSVLLIKAPPINSIYSVTSIQATTSKYFSKINSSPHVACAHEVYTSTDTKILYLSVNSPLMLHRPLISCAYISLRFSLSPNEFRDTLYSCGNWWILWLAVSWGSWSVRTVKRTQFGSYRYTNTGDKALL